MGILSDAAVLNLMLHPETVEPDNPSMQDEIGFEAFVEAWRRGIL